MRQVDVRIESSHFKFTMKLLVNILKYSYISSRLNSDQPKEYRNFIGYVPSQKLVRRDGEVVDVLLAFRSTKIIAYYFSAAWCNPCKDLLPKLRKAYTEAKKQDIGLEVIFVSSDYTADIGREYFLERHGDWYAVPFDEEAAAELIRMVHNVHHIPHLIVFRVDGSLITREGIGDLRKHGLGAVDVWKKQIENVGIDNKKI